MVEVEKVESWSKVESGRKTTPCKSVSLNSASQSVVLGVDVASIGKPDYSDPEVANHKKQFDEWLIKNYEDTANTSYVISRKSLEFIKEVLLGNKQFKTPTERFNFRAKRYKLLSNNRVGVQLKHINFFDN